jgi:iron complex outermembrane receptor protein
VVGWLSIPGSLLAQSSVAVSGSVVDQSGGAVAGATVRLLRGGIVVQTGETDAQGVFSLPAAPKDTYVVEVLRDLFLPARLELVVAETAPAPMRVTLQVNTLREELTVTGTAPGAGLSAPAGTGSRLGLTVRDTPATVTIVPRAVLEARGVTDTQDALKNVPGVTAAAQPGAAGSVSYRGFGSSNITQLFNGISVQYDAIAARPVDSWVYDRVEAIGGPSSFLYGAGAVGGSFNYITKVAEPGRNAARAQLRAGSFGTVEGSAGFNRTVGSGAVRHAFQADVNQSRTDGYVDDTERSAFSSVASWRADFGSRASHTLAVEYQNEEADRVYWGTPLLNPTTGNGRILESTRFKNYNSADGSYEQTVLWVRSVTGLQLGGFRLTNTVYHYDALRDYQNVEVYRFDATNTNVVRSTPLLQRHDQQLTGNRTEAAYAGRIGRLPSDWSFGADVSANTQTRFPLSLTTTVSVVDPVSFTTESFFSIPGIVPGFVPDRTNDVGTIAAFAENRTKLSARFSVVTALRAERIVLEGTNRRPATVSPTNPAFFKNTYTPVTGRAGLVFAVTPASNVYAQFSTAADPPAGILTTASFAQVRDFDLSTGQQVEAGTKLSLPGERGSMTAAVFRIVRNNLAIADPLNPGVTIPVGQQSARGLELALSLLPVKRVRADANYAFVDASFDDLFENVGGVAVSRAGNVPGNTPSHVANVWLTVTPVPAIDVALDARWVSSRFGNPANTVGDEGYALVGFSGTWRASPRLAVTGRVRNVTDEIYAAWVTGTPMFFLGAPRSADMTLRVSF